MLVAMFIALNPLHWHLTHSWWLPPLVFILDIIIIEFPLIPHPVRGIGWVLRQLARPLFSFKYKIFGGIMALVLCIVSSAAICAFLISLPGFFGIIFSIYLGFSGLALGELVQAGRKAQNALKGDDIAAARLAVGQLVSRDVDNMERSDLYRSLAESLSENFCDAFVGPFFWLVLTGPAGLWVYKTISTMDSMWGYKTDQWREIGMASARFEDGMSYIPARLSALHMFIAAPLAGFHCSWKNFRKAMKQAKKMESPNSGYSMGVAAWTHMCRMGGPTSYHGEIKEKPLLGPEGLEDAEGTESILWNEEKIDGLMKHLRVSGALTLLLMWGVGLIIGTIIQSQQ